MNTKFITRNISFLFVLLLLSCAKEEIDLNDNNSFELEGTEKLRNVFNESRFYTPPGRSTLNNRVVFNTSNRPNDGDDSRALQRVINNMPATGGVIEIPDGVYYLSKIKLKSNVNLEISRGVTIYHSTGLTDGVPSRIFDLGGPGQPKLSNVSIYGKGGRFTIDLSVQPINMDVAVMRIGEVDNFRVANFNIKDNRTEFASILISYVDKSGVAEPWSHNGVIENIAQTDAHTGYGLIQGYAADNVLFKNLSCEGGITLRLETDDRQMKAAGKGGVRRIFAETIKGRNGLTPVMLSPHFAQNGRVVVDGVKAIGCAYAVRVEHGFLEIFANAADYPTSSRNNAIRFEDDIERVLGGDAVATVYKRNRGRNWAARISNDFTRAALNSNHPLLEPQLRNVLPGKFDTSVIRNVEAIYKNNKGAKIKQEFLRYLPCDEWSKVQLPSGLNVPTGFEYHGPSVGVVFDNTNNSGVDGNFTVNVRNAVPKGFPAGYLLNVEYNSDKLCDKPFNTISR